MAIARVSQQSSASVYSSTLSHTVPSGATLALVVVRQVSGNTNAAPTLGGVAMTLVATTGVFSEAGFNQTCVSLWSLVSPTAGASTLAPNGTLVRGFSIACYSDTDTATPIRATQTITRSGTGATTAYATSDPAVVLASATNDLVVLGIGYTASGGTLTGVAAGASTTLATSVLEDGGGSAFFERAGAASVTVNVDLTFSAGFVAGYCEVSLVPATSGVSLAGAGTLRLAGASTIAVQTVSVIPSADVLARVEVWSDYECAGGLTGRLAVLPAVIACRRTRRLQDVATVELTIPLGSDGSAALLEERVIRTVYRGGSYDEWRIKGITEAHTVDGGLVLAISAVGPEQDLATRAVVLRTEADGSVSFNFELLSLSIRDHLQAAILPALAAAGSGYWGVGTINPLAPVDLVYASSNPLELVRRLAQATGSEWRVRRLGVASYVIDFLWQAGDEWTTAQIRAGVNAAGIQRQRSSAEQMTRGIPLGAELEGRRATMARNRWRVTAIVGLDVTLADPLGGDGPIAFDGQLNTTVALEVRTPTGLRTGITASVALTQTITVVSVSTPGLAVGMLVEICRAGGADLTSLDAPVGVGLYGVIARPIDRPETPGTVNLIPNPAMRVWSGADTNAPDGWAPVGAATLYRTTTPGLQRFAGQSCRIQVSGAVGVNGLQCPAVTLAPTAATPYVIGYVSVWLAAGAARVELVAYAAAMSVTTMTFAGGVVTVVTGTDHGLSVGDTVAITGATQVSYNVVATVASVTAVDTFTFRILDTPTTPATGTLVARKAWVIPDGTNGKALILQTSAWADIWVTDQRLDFNALGIVGAYLRVVQEGAVALDGYWDAAQLTQGIVNEPFIEGSGATQLWQETNRQLLLLSQPLVRFDVDVVNLAAADAAVWSRYAFGIGQVAALLDADVPVNATTRVVELEDDLVRVGTLRVSLSSRPEDVTDLLVRPPRPDRLRRGRATDTSLSLQASFRRLTDAASLEVRLSARPANSRIKYQVLLVGDELPQIGDATYGYYSGPFTVNLDQTSDLILAAYAIDGNQVSSIQTWPLNTDKIPAVTLGVTEPVAGTARFTWIPTRGVAEVRIYYTTGANWPTLDGTLTGILNEASFIGTINVREDGGSVARAGTPLAGVLDAAGTSRTGIGGLAWQQTGVGAATVVRAIVVPRDINGVIGARASATLTISGAAAPALTVVNQGALTNSAGGALVVGDGVYANASWTPSAAVVNGTHNVQVYIRVDGGDWEPKLTVASPVATTTARVRVSPYTKSSGKFDPTVLVEILLELHVTSGNALLEAKTTNGQSVQVKNV